MKLIAKGASPPVWTGYCRKCRAQFEASDKEVRQRKKVERDMRDRTEFEHVDCPECGSPRGGAVILYPSNAPANETLVIDDPLAELLKQGDRTWRDAMGYTGKPVHRASYWRDLARYVRANLGDMK